MKAIFTHPRPVNRSQPQSKDRRRLMVSLLVLTGAVTAPAQTLSIDWSKIAGGGGTSTRSVYSVSGTIGQPDAGGPMSGGNFSVTGGFWSLINVEQTPGAPTLAITFTATNTAMVSWPSPSTGFNLQQNTDLNTSNWTSPSETVVDSGTIKYIIVNPTIASRSFRLRK